MRAGASVCSVTGTFCTAAPTLNAAVPSPLLSLLLCGTIFSLLFSLPRPRAGDSRPALPGALLSAFKLPVVVHLSLQRRLPWVRSPLVPLLEGHEPPRGSAGLQQPGEGGSRGELWKTRTVLVLLRHIETTLPLTQRFVKPTGVPVPLPGAPLSVRCSCRC